jgi:hypothetical protein
MCITAAVPGSLMHFSYAAICSSSSSSCGAPILGCLVDQLVKGWVDVVGKLNLRNGRVALAGQADGKANYALPAQDATLQ